MLFDPKHRLYEDKRVDIVDSVYISSGRRRGPYLGSFMINYLEVYFDESSYVCDVEGLIGNPRRRGENLVMPPERCGNFVFEGESDKVPALPFCLVDSTSLYQFENCLLIGNTGDQAVKVFVNFGFFTSSGQICGAYANINKYI